MDRRRYAFQLRELRTVQDKPFLDSQDTFPNSPGVVRKKDTETGSDVTEDEMVDQSEGDCTASTPDKDDQLRFEDEQKLSEQPVDEMLYRVAENPPIPLAVVFGLQQVMLSINGCVGLPILLAPFICAGDLSVVKAELVSTFLVTSGISTFIQTTIGLRLPVLQGGNYLILPAIAGILSVDHLQCPHLNTTLGNRTDGNLTTSVWLSTNGTEVDRTEIWQIRMREIQGAIIMSSLAELLLGASGALNVLLRFIGPITVTPVIMLIGLSLFQFGTDLMENQWGIGYLTTISLVLFATILRNVKTPIITWSRKRKFHVAWVEFFKLFPIVLSLIIAWSLCGILTAANALPDDPSEPAYTSRTDAALDGLHRAKWFFLPYPGQWGLPTCSFTSFMIMMTIMVASIIESVGDYYACARVCRVGAPPLHAINRGLAVEGLVCLIGGWYGSGIPMTTYSANIGAIAITKVGSRLCFQIGGLIFILCGVMGKLGAALATIPEPVLGGLLFTSFAFIVGSGMSNLARVDLRSSRNQAILGFSITLGLSIPTWLGKGNAFKTGYAEADLVINAFLSNAIFVGGITAALLDNLAPGTLEERGMTSWSVTESPDQSTNQDIYDLPFIMSWVRKIKLFRYVPFMPTYDAKLWSCSTKCRRRSSAKGTGENRVGLSGNDVHYKLANSGDLHLQIEKPV